jgi:predicted RNA-binding Zn-ribbon protein involved in translation (DUF1610 family)
LTPKEIKQLLKGVKKEKYLQKLVENQIDVIGAKVCPDCKKKYWADNLTEKFKCLNCKTEQQFWRCPKCLLLYHP